jgi:hypothetical protein
MAVNKITNAMDAHATTDKGKYTLNLKAKSSYVIKLLPGMQNKEITVSTPPKIWFKISWKPEE